jgi:hypothetical protein
MIHELGFNAFILVLVSFKSSFVFSFCKLCKKDTMVAVRIGIGIGFSKMVCLVDHCSTCQ